MGKYDATYSHIKDLKQALDEGVIKRAEISAYKCKKELFINHESGQELFSAYYGTNNACDDICVLLGLDLPEDV